MQPESKRTSDSPACSRASKGSRAESRPGDGRGSHSPCCGRSGRSLGRLARGRRRKRRRRRERFDLGYRNARRRTCHSRHDSKHLPTANTHPPTRARNAARRGSEDRCKACSRDRRFDRTLRFRPGPAPRLSQGQDADGVRNRPIPIKAGQLADEPVLLFEELDRNELPAGRLSLVPNFPLFPHDEEM